ncbi:urease accessory protein UreD [Vibrio coralliilyticus]|uniref:urease accessory protein UreD n=1 Tax=Vibrio coralliilyticus TaxID=190893 RepID=UPI000BAC208D|nr:urease accessory protein UreD [Vibrio coralliilyticus]NOI74311.1 urease accessory protein UreD [Vibrio coralliilyticus]PAW04910.1 urease accessory protein ureD [Vibrio coralliilyticus]
MMCDPAVAFAIENNNQRLDKLIQSDTESGWKAKLKLLFTDRGDKTVIRERQQQGPLAIQRPLYPEGKACHTYLLHPPGGVVGGDTLRIDTQVAQGAHVLVTTPGATKFYRSEQRYAHQQQVLTVESGGLLQWLPQENIFFPDAHARLDTQIHLEKDAQFVGWEMHCFGRPALNEGFSSGHLVGKTEIYRQGKKILTEGLNIRGGDKYMKQKGLLGFPMSGTLYISSQDDDFFHLVQSLLSNIQSQVGTDKIIIAATQLEELVVIRALGHWSEVILNSFQLVWQQARQQWTGTLPHPPRIWAT